MPSGKSDEPLVSSVLVSIDKDDPDCKARFQTGNRLTRTNVTMHDLTEIRLNYIFWLQDLLDTTGDGYRDQYDPQREVMGFDM